MKKILPYLIILVCLSCKKQSDRIEKELYNCFLNELTSLEKTKFLELLENYEKYLIKHNILGSSEPHAYWEFYKNIATTGEFDLSNEFEFSNKIKFLDRDDISANQALIKCHNDLYSSNYYKDSVHFKLYETIQNRKSKNDIMNVAIATSDILSTTDFELQYYRLITLMFIEDNR